MRSKKCIKFLIFSITCLLCLSFSSDANALELTTEVQATGEQFTINYLTCSYANGTTVDRQTNCVNPIANNETSNVIMLRRKEKIHTIEGNYYRTFLSLKTIGTNPEILYRIDTNYDNFNLVSFNEVTSDYLSQQLNINGNTGNNTTLQGGFTESYYAKFFEVTLKAKHTGDYYFEIGNNTNPFIWSLGSETVNVYVGITTIEEFEATGSSALNEKDDQDREDLENQSSQTDSDSSDSQDQANSTGTTLLGAFSGFVSALTSATPSDCSIDMDLGNLDMGDVDFCELDPPAGFSAIGSVLMILFCVPLSISTARKVISLFRSFQ